MPRRGRGRRGRGAAPVRGPTVRTACSRRPPGTGWIRRSPAPRSPGCCAPAGVFGLLWSGPDRQVEWVSDVLGRRPRPDPAGSGPPGGAIPAADGPSPSICRSPSPNARGPVRAATVELDDLAGLSGTFSVVIVGGRRGATPAWRRCEIGPPVAVIGAGPVELPMVCRCWRAYRTEAVRRSLTRHRSGRRSGRPGRPHEVAQVAGLLAHHRAPVCGRRSSRRPPT